MHPASVVKPVSDSRQPDGQINSAAGNTGVCVCVCALTDYDTVQKNKKVTARSALLWQHKICLPAVIGTLFDK